MKRLMCLLGIVTCMFVSSSVFAAEIVKDTTEINRNFEYVSNLSIDSINNSDFIVYRPSNIPSVFNKKLKLVKDLYVGSSNYTYVYSMRKYNDKLFTIEKTLIKSFDANLNEIKTFNFPTGFSSDEFDIHNNKIYVFGVMNNSLSKTTVYVLSLDLVIENTYTIDTEVEHISNAEFTKDHIYIIGKKNNYVEYGFAKYNYQFEFVEKYFPENDLFNTKILDNGDIIALNQIAHSENLGDSYFEVVKINGKTKEQIWKTRLYSSIHLYPFNIGLKVLNNGNYLISAGSIYELDKNGDVVNSCMNCTNALDSIYLDNKLYSAGSEYNYLKESNSIGYLEIHSLKYKLTLNEGVNGRYRVNRPNPRSGEKVIIKLRKENGYELDTIKVTKEDKSEVRLTKLSDKEYSFVMPEADTTIDVSYKKIKE